MSEVEEAAFVASYRPRSVLDAGCGSGRVAVELARLGIEVVGADKDDAAIARARAAAPHIEWHVADLAELRLPERFDVVLMAGNVVTFLEREKRGAVLRNMAAHLEPGGLLVAGFQTSMAYLDIEEYEELAEEAMLTLEERYSSWQRRPWRAGDLYVVEVHRNISGAEKR